MAWVRDCVEVLVPMLEPDSYHWTRGDSPHITSLMRFDGKEVRLYDVEGQGVILDIRLARSPKDGIVREVQQVLDLLQRIEDMAVSETGTS